MSDTAAESFEKILLETLPLMPRNRERNKRNRSLTLDDLIDEQRSHNNLSSSSLDLLLMSYRYHEAFKREANKFLKRSLKPSKALDLWQLIFTALLTRDHSSASAMIFAAQEFAKKEFGSYMVGALRAFCQRILENKNAIKISLKENPVQLLPQNLISRWSKHRFMNLDDIAYPLVDRPESGILAFDENLTWQKRNIQDFKTQKLQALNEGSWHYLQYLFSEFDVALSAAKKISLLDSCAAPGGKLIALLQYASQKKHLIEAHATEAKYRRLQRLNENLSHWNTTAHTSLHAWGEGSRFAVDKHWNILLIDLPCSGSGTLAQRPDLLLKDWNTLLTTIIPLQKSIVNDLMSLSFDTAFVSICSIDPEEIDAISDLFKTQPNFYSSKINPRAMEHIVAWKISRKPLS